MRVVDVVGAVDTCEDEEEVEDAEDIGRHTKSQESKNNNQEYKSARAQEQECKKRIR